LHPESQREGRHLGVYKRQCVRTRVDIGQN